MIDYWYVVNTVIEKCVYRLPVDVEKVCRAFGAYLLPYSEAVEKSVLSWEDIERMAGTRDGFTLDAGEEWAIVYNDRIPMNRRRFTYAEELMHRLLLHSQDDDFLYCRQSWTDETYNEYETQAKRAAGMLLVPPSVYYKYRRVYGTDQLAKLCGVSGPCLYTVSKYYDENEDEIRAKFSKKAILCDTAKLKRKRPLRPRAVVGESL